MTLYSGIEGSLWAKTQGDWLKVAEAKAWTFTMNAEALDATTLGETDRTLEDGVRSCSGSCSLYYYNPEDGAADTGAGFILKKILKPLSIFEPSFDPNTWASGSRGDSGIRSTKLAFRLGANKNLAELGSNTSSTQKYIWVNAFITSFTMTMSVGEVLSCDCTFEVDGAPVDNTFSTYGDGLD